MYSKKQREQLLAEFEESDLSAFAFCRKAGISRATLRSWQAERESETDSPRPSLVARVKIAPGVAPASPVEIHVGRLRVVVPPNFDPKHLRAVLESLGAFA